MLLSTQLNDKAKANVGEMLPTDAFTKWVITTTSTVLIGESSILSVLTLETLTTIRRTLAQETTSAVAVNIAMRNLGASKYVSKKLTNLKMITEGVNWDGERGRSQMLAT